MAILRLRLESLGGVDHSTAKLLVKPNIATSVRELEKDRQRAKVSLMVRQAEPAFNGIKSAVKNLSRNVSRDLCSIPNPLLVLALLNILGTGRDDAKLRACFIKGFPDITRRGPLETCQVS
jgi:hypothetical protein